MLPIGWKPVFTFFANFCISLAINLWMEDSGKTHKKEKKNCYCNEGYRRCHFERNGKTLNNSHNPQKSIKGIVGKKNWTTTPRKSVSFKWVLVIITIYMTDDISSGMVPAKGRDELFLSVSLQYTGKVLWC